MHSKIRRVREKIPIPLSFIIFFSVLNGMMFQVAIPDISDEFILTPSEVSWVMTGYIVVFAIGSLIYGKLADIYSIRNLITVGLVLMNAGSVLGSFSLDYSMLIGARLLQAGGGAAIPALAMLIVTRYFEPNLRGRILGIIASTVALASGIGPVIGGFVSASFHWRYLFLICLITVVTIPCFRIYLPDDKQREGSFDTKGAFLISVGITSLLLFITQNGWSYVLLGLTLIVWFSFHIKRSENPFISPALLSGSNYRNTIIATFLFIGTIFGMMFMVPIMLRDLNGLDANLIGLTIFPGALTAVFMGAIGGRLSDRKGSTFVVYLGSAFLFGGFFFLSIFTCQSAIIISLFLISCYTGFSFLQSSLPHTLSLVIPRGEAGIGMGIYNLMFFISGAFSTAGIGRFLDAESTDFHINPFALCVEGWIYSNIFVSLAVIAAIATLLFFFTFRARNKNRYSFKS